MKKRQRLPANPRWEKPHKPLLRKAPDALRGLFGRFFANQHIFCGITLYFGTTYGIVCLYKYG